jgi:hypothetical protein
LWLAQTGGVDDAVGLAPFLMVPFLRRETGLVVMHVLDWLPNAFLWWDPRKRERIAPPYAYPGFFTHCLAQCIFAGDGLRGAADRRPPAAPRATIVVNASDPAVNNNVARELAAVWAEHGDSYALQSWDDLGSVHDVVDPSTYPRATTLVYPRLRALIDAGAG